LPCVRYPLKWETDVPEIVLLEDREADPINTAIVRDSKQDRQIDFESWGNKIE
jgi:hypothetical protein